MLAPWLVLQPSTATRQVGALKKPNVGLNKASRAPSVWVPTLSACQSAKREAVWHSKPPPTDLAKVGHLACLEEVDRTCRDLTGEMCDRSPLGGSLESQRSEHSALLGQLEENERPLPTTVKTMVKTQKVGVPGTRHTWTWAALLVVMVPVLVWVSLLALVLVAAYVCVWWC